MDTNTSNQPVTISTDPPLYPASDFRLLRSEGIQKIQQLAGISWTDYNTHDPGITILDLLCYAITDLSNRLDYDIKDLLATKTGNAYESLYSPAQVLTCNPVTLSDFRKVLLDIDGVKNAWIDKQTEPDIKLYYFPEENVFRLTDDESKGQSIIIKGIYNILVDTSGSTETIKNRLQSYRNLCEDYNKITAPTSQPVAVSGFVEIGQTADINQTVANILSRIARFIAPAPGFYTLAEMLAKGKTMDEIFEGPALAHGFIDSDELNNIHKKKELHTSDIIREIMDEPGVLRVSNIRIYDSSLETENNSSSTTSDQNWFLPLDTARIPSLDVDKTIGTSYAGNAGSILTFKKNGVPLTIDTKQVVSFFNTNNKAQAKPALPLPIEYLDMVPVQGDYYSLEDYYSIQNQFPQVYGIGEAGLPESAALLRKVQAKQLKAYLLFFEKILADYCSQAAHLKDLFSFHNTYACTYFSQPIQQIVPGADEIFISSSNAPAACYESHDKALQRHNRLLNHLIARFGESLSAYTLYEQSYEQKNTPAGASKTTATTKALEKLVSDKLRFLANYPLISNNRGKAFNYGEESWDTDNTSGLQKRIAAKLGIENDNVHSLADGSEGFYLLEHILLRPVQKDSTVVTNNSVTKTINNFEDAGKDQDHTTICISTAHGLLDGEQIAITGSKIYDNGMYKIKWLSADRFEIATTYKGAEENTAQWTRVIHYLSFSGTNEHITQPDFYSLQLTCIFPADAGRFANNPDFRTFVENTVREETPVHLTVYIRWLAPDQMLQFENAFRSFLTALQVQQQDDNIRWRASRNSLIDMLPLGINTYPLADIPVIMPEGATELIVQYDEPAKITLLYSQPDVVYRIWDQETGKQMNESQQDKDIRGNDGQLSLKTIRLRDNYLFSIEAFNPATQLRVRLFQTVLVRIGINTGLTVTTKESEIEYGTKAIIIIKNTQTGTAYQLLSANKKTQLSDAVDSNDGGDIEISTKEPVQEDTIFIIKATNTNTHKSAFLDAKPAIKVYPNTALESAIENTPVADYKGELTIILKNTQESTSYFLRIEDVDDDTMATLKGTIIGEPVTGNNGTIKLPVSNLTEDLTVSITAKKKDSGLERKFPGSIDFLVKPDPDKTLSVVEKSIKPGNTATIQVSNTQPGILYQLRKVNSDNTYTNVGSPVYHHKNRGIGEARLERDFVIDKFTGNIVLLPAGAIEETTTFSVLAIKPGSVIDKSDTFSVLTTKQQVELSKTITIKIKK